MPDPLIITDQLKILLANVNTIHDSQLALEAILHTGQDILGASNAAGIILDESFDVAYHAGPDPAIKHLTSQMMDFRIRNEESQDSSAIIQSISSEENSNAGDNHLLFDMGYQYAYCLPICHSHELLGLLGFYSLKKPSPDKQILQWIDLLLGIATLVFHNARLTQTVLSQAAEMGVFYKTTVALAGQKDTCQLLDLTLSRALTLLNCQMSFLFLAEDNLDHLHVVAHVYEDPDSGASLLESATKLAARAADEQDIILNEELLSTSGSASLDTDNADQAHQRFRALAIPMDSAKQFIAVLVVIAPELRQPFSENDCRRARLIAYQAVNVIGLSNLIDAERNQRRVAEALQSASLAISSGVSLNEVLDRILEQVMHAFSCDAANIMIQDKDRRYVIRSRGYSNFGLEPDQVAELVLNARASANQRPLIDGRAITVPNVVDDPAYKMPDGLEWVQSWAGIPISFGNEILGFINLDSASPNSLTASNTKQLKAFASHAAIAVHKARIYDRLSKEHERLQQIYMLGQDIGASLDPNEILTHLLEACLTVLGGMLGVVYALNLRSHQLEILAKHSTSENAETLIELPSVHNLAQRLFQAEKPDFEYLSYPEQAYWLLGLPLHYAGIPRRVVLIWVQSELDFEHAWLDTLAALGQQAALSLANANKHAELQRRLNEIELLQHIAAAIAKRLEFDAILGELTNQLHERLGYQAVHVYIRQGDTMLLRKASGDLPSVSEIPFGQGIIGRVAQTGQAELITDVTLDPDYFVLLETTLSELAVPILVSDKVIGVFNIESSDPTQIDASAKELLSLLADQVSIALQNAMLYKQASDTVESLETRVKARTSALEAVAEQARAAEKAKAQFVADVSHELRTPLTNIGLYLDLLEIGPNERHQEYFTTMRRETDRLKILIEQLLSISQLDTDQVYFHPQPTDINSLMAMLVVDREKLITQNGINLQIKTKKNLPQVSVDPRYIMQVMTNLLTNATNYTAEGGSITLRSDIETRNGQLGVVFSINNTGLGIPEDEQNRIFERFFRGRNGRDSGIAGTGLGLAICKEIVEKHYGSIEFTSSDKNGTTFKVWLPAFKKEN